MRWPSENAKQEYGVDPMTASEELELLEKCPFKAKTRSSKVRLVTAFRKIQGNSEALIAYTRRIPEEENAVHAELVAKLADEYEALERRMGEIFDGRNL